MAGYAYRGQPIPAVPVDAAEQETARIIAAAQTEAMNIRRKAREEAQQTKLEASREADTILARAESIAATRAEVEVLRSRGVLGRPGRPVVATRGGESRVFGSAREASMAIGQDVNRVARRLSRSNGEPVEIDGWVYEYKFGIPADIVEDVLGRVGGLDNTK